MTEYSVPAVGLGIIEDGQVKIAKVFGDLQQGVTAPDNAIFNVASITKTVTTLLTLKLVEEGEWDLDEPLFHYWTDPDVADDPLHKKLTTRHVLTHQTGFVNWRWNHPTKKLTFDYEPGTHFQYSGEGFEYLRRALEHKFGKSIGQLADSLVFIPLDMHDTRYAWDEGMDESRFAAWHDADGKKYQKSYKTRACGADDLLTTVEDFCKFGIWVMNGAGLSPELFNEMVSPQSDIRKYRAQGFGWSIITGLPDGEYAISHGGSDYGVKTIAYFLPESGRGVVVFTNGDNGMSVFNNIIRNTFDIGNNIYECMYYRPNLPEVVSVPEAVLEKYTGRYRQPDGSVNVVSMKENVIILSGDRSPKTIYYPEAEARFFRREFDSEVEFIAGQKGKIEKMVIYYNGDKYCEAVKLE